MFPHLINLALAARTQARHEHQERVSYKQTSAMLTNWKKQEDLDFQGGQTNFTSLIIVIIIIF